MKRRNVGLLVLLVFVLVVQFVAIPLMAADPSGTYLEELKVKRPRPGKAINDQLVEILLKISVSDYLEIVWPFLNPPSLNFKWVETPVELQNYFSKNKYSDYVKSEFEYIDFTGLIQKSYKIPCPIYNKARIIQAGGGMVMFFRHIFAEGYYRSKFNNDDSNTDNFYYMTKNQPWFEWNGKSYNLRRGQTVKTILKQCAGKNGDLILYRGAYPEEFEGFLKLRNGQKPTKPVVSSSSAGPTKCPKVFFLTPDKLKAVDWSKGVVEKITFPASVWQNWNDESGLYAGIEYDYVEIALYRDPAIAFFQKNVIKLGEAEVKALKTEADAKKPTGNVDNPDAH